MKKYPYLPHTEEEISQMLSCVGVNKIDDLFMDLPEDLKVDTLDIPNSKDEFSVYRDLENLSLKNTDPSRMAVYKGGGIYYHFIPSAVDSLSSMGNFLTAYTPYQPEVSQGSLQTLFEFQTMISEITGMEVSNSSMYDGATALAEAVLMACRINKRSKVLFSESLNPEYFHVTQTYCFGEEIGIEKFSFDSISGQTDYNELKNKLSDDISAVVVGYTNFFGIIEDLEKIKKMLPEKVLLIVCAEPFALGILEKPGNHGADIVVGEGQPLGNRPYLGGPNFGFFSSKEKYIRKMPGRIIGETDDIDGKKGYVMVLQTREQHIRRDKATSNICSNHAHNALRATIYLSLIGKWGFREIARRSFSKAHYLYEKLLKNEKIYSVFNGPFFNEFVVKIDEDIPSLNRELLKRNILGPVDVSKYFRNMDNCALFAVTEMNRNEDIEYLVATLEELL